jgi:circadian clock protein KaiB
MPSSAGAPTDSKAVPQAEQDTFVLRLYIVEGAPNSVRASANLETICQTYLQDRFCLEIVDIVQQPLRALEDGILLTPSLLKLAPPPTAKIVGTLDDERRVLLALGLRKAAE